MAYWTIGEQTRQNKRVLVFSLKRCESISWPRGVFPSDHVYINRLDQVTALFPEGSPSPCTGSNCGAATVWARIDGWKDWDLFEARTPSNRQVSCKIQTTKGLFREWGDEGRQPEPQLVVLATDSGWSNQIVQYEPGYKITEVVPAGEKTNLFGHGKEFRASVKNGNKDGYLYVDSGAVEFANLLDALRKGHNITVSYRKAGTVTITRDHLSLYGFHDAYKTMISRCKSMVSRIP
ncbi:MAG: hypothetical protein QOI12_5209 [Alphaproteobacteria bacterium]|jgi:hypothetical protein|nr:hypothetical protein [Alphaproteobacteria bacterium]